MDTNLVTIAGDILTSVSLVQSVGVTCVFLLAWLGGWFFWEA